MNASVTDNRLAMQIASGDALDPREFTVEERMSTLTRIDIVAHCRNPSVSFEANVGQAASLSVTARKGKTRTWQGICMNLEQVAAEPNGYSSYRISIVPLFWVTTQRRNHRMFQQISDPDIVLQLLGEWAIPFKAQFDAGAHRTREYRVQYGESDYDFICRLLEDAGIAFCFDETSTLVLTDAPQSNPSRGELPYTAVAQLAPVAEYVTDVAVGAAVRPGRYVIFDHDGVRAPNFPLIGEAEDGIGIEPGLERFHYREGAFLFGAAGGDTPVADDRGASRHLESEGVLIAQRRLEAQRSERERVELTTTAHDLGPGVVFSVGNHPHGSVADGKLLLVVASRFSGTAEGNWVHRCTAASAALPYRPPLKTPKPKALGCESAMVVGPAGEEIHCDEFGRVRVHFYWDRESEMNEQSSCWIHVSQPWAGTGFGGSNLPRIGQEVIVDFLGGDPDRPVITGRVFTGVSPTPYKLPDNKTRSGWRSMSSPGGGGFNEIMFEDLKGSEQLYMQAERNMDTLVKNDQTLVVMNDRNKSVENDETTAVGNDRRERVGNDEAIAVGNDRTRLVGNDETITIRNDRTTTVENDDHNTIGHDRLTAIANDEEHIVGNNRSLTIQNNAREMVGTHLSRVVGSNASLQVGQDRSVTVERNQTTRIGETDTRFVGGDQRLTVGGARSVSVDANQSTDISGSQNLSVGQSANERILLAKATQVGGAYSITVGGIMNTTVGGASTEQVALHKRIDAGQSITLSCGSASLTLESSGNITLKGTGILIEGEQVKVVGDPIELN